MRGSSSVEMGRLNVTSIRRGLTGFYEKDKRLAVISVIKPGSCPSGSQGAGDRTDEQLIYCLCPLKHALNSNKNGI